MSSVGADSLSSFLLSFYSFSMKCIDTSLHYAPTYVPPEAPSSSQLQLHTKANRWDPPERTFLHNFTIELNQAGIS